MCASSYRKNGMAGCAAVWIELGVQGLEPRTSGLKGRCTKSGSDDEASTYDDPTNRLGVLLGVLAELEPELAVVMQAWPTLPEAIRSGILAMVQASTRGDD